jgi:hypothetical protein
MRSTFACLALCSAFALPSFGCKATSQVVVGVITNLAVSSDLTDVRMEAFRSGVSVGQKSWTISDTHSRDYVLPGSFDWYGEEKGGTPLVDIVATAFVGAELNPRVTRAVTLQLQSEETLFYRMALVKECNKDLPNAKCDEGFTCVEGICRAQTINPKTLNPYTAGREGVVECDSGSRFIDTGSCSTGTCLQLPISPKGCDADEFCQEGTCYKFDPERPRALEFSETCSPENGDTCRESTTLSCSHTGLLGGGADPARCRQKCSVDADCTRRLPDAVAESIPATLAICSQSNHVCTFACDPVNAGNSGCISGTRCQVLADNTSIAPDCVVASSTGGTVAIGAACNTQHASDDCTGGSSCVTRNGANATCLKNCFVDDASTCPNGQLCHAVQTNNMSITSTKYGVCF